MQYRITKRDKMSQRYVHQYQPDAEATINSALHRATGYTPRQWDQNNMATPNTRSIGDIILYDYARKPEQNARNNESTKFRGTSGLEIDAIIPFSVKPSDFPNNAQNLPSTWLKSCVKLVEKTANDDQKARRLIRQAVFLRTGVAGNVMIRQDLDAARDLAIKEEGYSQGHAQGHAQGYAAGLTDQGFAAGKAEGLKEGRRQAYAEKESIAADPTKQMDLTGED